MSNVSTEKPCVICLGAKIPPSFSCLLKDLPRPEIDGVKWVADENLFVGFQNFYKKRSQLDLRSITPEIRDKIFYPFFPILARPKSIELTPNPAKANALKLKLKLASIKDPAKNLSTQKSTLATAMKGVLQSTSVAFQTYDCDLQITLAHISPKAHENPGFYEKINSLTLKGQIAEAFYLDKPCMIEVIKEEAGLVYNYYRVE